MLKKFLFAAACAVAFAKGDEPHDTEGPENDDGDHEVRDNDHKYLTADGLFVDFNGESDSFKIFFGTRNATMEERHSDGYRFWRVKWDSLVEVDSDGMKVDGGKEDDLDFIWTVGNQTWESGITSDYVNGVANLSNGATLQVRHDVFKEIGTVEIAPNVTAEVITGRMKVSVLLDNYVFTQPDSYLDFRVNIADSVGGRREHDDNEAEDHEEDDPKDEGEEESDREGKRGKRKLRLKGRSGLPISAAIDFETYAYLDGSDSPSPVNITSRGNHYWLRFPHFQKSLVYDPDFYALPDSASSIALSFGAILVAALAMVFVF